MANQHTSDLEAVRSEIGRMADLIRSLAEQLDGSLLDSAAALSDCRGHIAVSGTGTSSSVARRFAHLLCCCGGRATYLSPCDAIHGGAGSLSADDVVVFISKSGRSYEVNELARIARGVGCRTIAIVGDITSELSRLVDHGIEVRTPEHAEILGVVATGSSLVSCAICDVLCHLVADQKKADLSRLAAIHPGGAVGELLRATHRGGHK